MKGFPYREAKRLLESDDPYADFSDPPNDSEPCRLRNAGGSERGKCDCNGPADCPNPPKFTAMELRMTGLREQMEGRSRSGGKRGERATETE